MRGDFTRDTFDVTKQFTRVLMQQGRVQLDADWNEQGSILLHFLRALAADLLGPHGGPTDNLGFGISVDPKTPNGDFVIGSGIYYVDGIRCENGTPSTYITQADFPLTDDDELEESAIPSLAYLDVWERDVTHDEDDSIREVALGGPDTTTRTRLVRQVRTLVLAPDAEVRDPTNVDWIEKHIPKYSATEKRVLIEIGLPLLRAAHKAETNPTRKDQIAASIAKFEKTLAALNGARLRARAFVPQPSTDPCTISPEAHYRGVENQLYRVEIHRSGGAFIKGGDPKVAATFKYSRENGCVTFPIRELAGKVATLVHLGRDERFGLREGDCVEVVDNEYVLRNRAEGLLFVQSIDRDRQQVTFDRVPESRVGQDPDKNPILRRWDHNSRGLTTDAGAALILEGEGNAENWLTLEDGVQIQFLRPAAGSDPTQFRTGDYWLIPARTATGDVEWPGPTSNPDALPPRGIQHHYAPLHRIAIGVGGKVTADPGRTLQRHFDALAVAS